LLAFGAGFRVGVSFNARPAGEPAWYHHKAAFYCINFVIELIVMYTYMLIRFDRRFHVPDGSHGPGHYSVGVPHHGKEKDTGGLSEHINTEEEAFGDDRPVSSEPEQEVAERQWDRRVESDLEKQDRGVPITS